MVARINLLGRPSVQRDGAEVAPPRGSKAWAVLAYLVLTPGAVPRARLMAMLFEEADDPGAALRWSLSQLRRALSGVATVGGDPLVLVPLPGTVVDADVVAGGTWAQALALPTFGGGLLEGVVPHVGAVFDLWLSTERRRLAGRTSALLQEAAHSRLAHGDLGSAVALATRLVAVDPLNEGGHELLVRALVAAGQPAAAAERAEQCRALFVRELGSPPSPAVAAALRHSSTPTFGLSATGVEVAIEGGVGAAHVGAYDRAIELLRSAAQGARSIGEDALLARSLAALGTVLVQGVRGRDEEGVSLLHEAIVVAKRAGMRDVAATAAQELGHVDTLRAHYPQMEAWFLEATSLADGDPRVLAWVAVYAGIGRTDQADYGAARMALDRAVELARTIGDRRAEAYAVTALGRWHLLRGEDEQAATVLEEACSIARAIGWTSFLPFPDALSGEVALVLGDLPAAERSLEHSYALACQVGDPCWQSYSLRGRGLLAAARGDEALALDLLLLAPEACRDLPDAHDWIEAHCMDALCGFAVRRRLPGAAAWVEELEAFASRRGMRELVARAALHRSGLGQAGARELAALLAEAVDNPLLHRLVGTPGEPALLAGAAAPDAPVRPPSHDG